MWIRTNLLFGIGFFLIITSCTDKSYPCPENGSTSPSAMGAHDAGQSKKEKKYKENGLINKKKPKKLSKK